MDHNPARLCVWPGYFDIRTSRSSGRRVPRDASVIKPDLEGLFLAARKLGIKKMKREEGISHPARPHAREGRLWVSRSGASQSVGSTSKEELLQLIGGEWRQMQRDQRDADKERIASRNHGKPGKSSSKSKSQGSSKSSGFKKRKSFKKK